MMKNLSLVFMLLLLGCSNSKNDTNELIDSNVFLGNWELKVEDANGSASNMMGEYKYLFNQDNTGIRFSRLYGNTVVSDLTWTISNDTLVINYELGQKPVQEEIVSLDKDKLEIIKSIDEQYRHLLYRK